MKLYATIESERAKKGQGGNRFIKTDMSLDEVSVLQAHLWQLSPNSNKYQLVIESDGKTLVSRVLEADEYKKTKGKKQKGNQCKYGHSICLKDALGRCMDTK